MEFEDFEKDVIPYSNWKLYSLKDKRTWKELFDYEVLENHAILDYWNWLFWKKPETYIYYLTTNNTIKTNVVLYNWKLERIEFEKDKKIKNVDKASLWHIVPFEDWTYMILSKVWEKLFNWNYFKSSIEWENHIKLHTENGSKFFSKDWKTELYKDIESFYSIEEWFSWEKNIYLDREKTIFQVYDEKWENLLFNWFVFKDIIQLIWKYNIWIWLKSNILIENWEQVDNLSFKSYKKENDNVFIFEINENEYISYEYDEENEALNQIWEKYKKVIYNDRIVLQYESGKIIDPETNLEIIK